MQLSQLETKGGSKRKKFLPQLLLLCAIASPILATKISPAGFTQDDVMAHVEIDGVNYGAFDHIDGLASEHTYGGALPGAATHPPQYRKVTLRRDFVTDPSLYIWAKNTMRARSELKNVHVVIENSEGEELSRYILKYCQPLSWTVEAANPALGGFHEKIDLAVQEIDIF